MTDHDAPEVADEVNVEDFPRTEQDLDRAKRVPRVKTMRRALRLTQEEFAVRYMIPVGTLRDWEQGQTKPDAAGQAYLRAIRGNPEAVARALLTVSRTPKQSEDFKIIHASEDLPWPDASGPLTG